MRADQLVAIVAGGVVGATLRWAITEVVPDGSVGWSVLLVNTGGSFLLGMVAAIVLRPEWPRHPAALAGLAAFCGSLTTFSTLAVAVAEALRDGSTAQAGARLGLSVALGLAAAALGWRINHGTTTTTPTPANPGDPARQATQNPRIWVRGGSRR